VNHGHQLADPGERVQQVVEQSTPQVSKRA
jgi:hypothetical protein